MFRQFNLPSPWEYDTDEEYQEALRAYDRELIDRELIDREDEYIERMREKYEN